MASQFSCPWDYDRKEIFADCIVHILGIVTAIGGAAVLIVIAVHAGNIRRVTAVAIYLGSLLTMFFSSAVYNLWPVTPFKWWLRRFDHSAIYLLIAATYTAFMLPVYGAVPAVALATIWIAALLGIAIKIVFPDRFDRMSVPLYLTRGWSGALTIGPVAAVLAPVTLLLILAGGALYSFGVVFHVWYGLRFQNAIWHGFVLAAAACHYAAVLTSVTE